MDREKVIKGLEICTKDIPMSNAVHKSDFCKECPYYNAENRYCWNQIVMMRDALALLKEQEVKEQISDAIHETAKQFRRQIVMCKDCRFKECEGRDGFIVCDITGESHKPEWFCADGERRDG